jgi:pyruvate dehydrogenase (quinone)
MAQTVSDFAIARLYQWGVRTIYGYPGDGINGLMGALARCEGAMEFVQVPHEELTAFMACGHAKFSGEIGVCLATSGPGAIHLLNGLYDAAMDHQPVVALVGQQKRTAIGSDYQQEVDLVSLFKDVAHSFVKECAHPAQARHLIDRAMRIARAERTVTCVIFPHDVQEEAAVVSPDRDHGVTYSGVGFEQARVLPSHEQLRRAAEVLNEGKKVAMLVGAGALGAHEEVLAIADRLGAGIAKALLGRATIPDDLPFVTGSIGLLGTRPSDFMMQNCDTLLMVGSSFPYSEWLPREGQARAVQIDIKPRMLSLRYPMEVNLHGDAKETMRALLPLLEPRQSGRWRARIEAEVSDWWKVLEERAMMSADPLNPQRVFWELSPRLPDGVVLTADSGSATNWWARDLRIRRGMTASVSGGLASMGCAMPYALASKFVDSTRPVIACVGDGAMQMLGNNVLISVGRFWRRWKDPRFITLVLNNRDLNQVTWEQRVMTGIPKFEASQVLPDFPYAEYGRMLGLEAVEMAGPDDVVPAWERALSADRPVVVEAHTDPEVPPLPPHINMDQAKKYLGSLLKGDPHRWRVVKQSVKHMWSGLLK